MGSLSKLTTQGQISVPAEVRHKLGLAPGSVLEWQEQDGAYLVRRAGRATSADIHAALFGASGAPKSAVNVKDALRKSIRKRHARR